MPLVVSYEYADWAGIPGIFAAAPTFHYYDLAYSEQTIREQWNQVLEHESFDVTTPWARAVAEAEWERDKPWWVRFN